uniref:PHD-type domain-containing protein n=1 Tax=Cyprinodon variegatus TaxID=28743 RepID=A0A3Q2FL57_CYPVA
MGKQGNGGSQVETDRLDEEWENVNSRKERGVSERQRAAKSVKKSHRWLNGLDDDDTSPDFVPYRKRSCTKLYNKVNQPSSEYTQPDQKHRGRKRNPLSLFICCFSLDACSLHLTSTLRYTVIIFVSSFSTCHADFCLCCGTKDIEIFHPLFKGGLCLKCKDNFTETLYRYDEDGYQSYCTICFYFPLHTWFICCLIFRSYCEDCLNILAGPGTFDSLKVVDPWVCYLCQPHQPHGALVPRDDWRFREPHRVYPSIPTKLRRPLRVLSLFDGIGTGKSPAPKASARLFCLSQLVTVSIRHHKCFSHPNDLVFLSFCMTEGTGRLFFDYYRILQLLKPKEDDPRPFFWLFENVVFMNTHDKVNICRFLEVSIHFTSEMSFLLQLLNQVEHLRR